MRLKPVHLPLKLGIAFDIGRIAQHEIELAEFFGPILLRPIERIKARSRGQLIGIGIGLRIGKSALGPVNPHALSMRPNAERC